MSEPTTNENIRVLEDDFVQVTEPDYDEVAEIILEAKGESWTMKEFAQATGISAPTLSRMINGKLTRPMSIENIVRIISNSEIDTSANIFRFARANGYMSKAEQQSLRSRMKLRETRAGFHDSQKQLMSVIIKSGLFERGCSIDPEVMEDRPGTLVTSLGKPIKYDFYLELEKDGKQYTWIFFIFPQKLEDYKIDKFDVERMTSQLVKDLSPVFMTDSWNSEEYADKKISFCFVVENLYEGFNALLGDAHFNNRFSSILINDSTNKVVEENGFSAVKFEANPCVFDMPVVIGITFEEDAVAEEITGDDFLFLEEGAND